MIDRVYAPVPDLMKLLPVHRGFPVPYIVQYDNKGIPLFTVNDAAKQYRCTTRKLCPICGTRLGKELWYVGGPGSAFDPNGIYFDSAMHHECMTYAMKVCPYLAVRQYSSDMEKRLPALEKRVTGAVMNDPTVDPTKPVVFVAVMSYGRTVARGGPLSYYSKPLRPYHGVEFWKDGLRLPHKYGKDLASIVVSPTYVDAALRLIHDAALQFIR